MISLFLRFGFLLLADFSFVDALRNHIRRYLSKAGRTASLCNTSESRLILVSSGGDVECAHSFLSVVQVCSLLGQLSKTRRLIHREHRLKLVGRHLLRGTLSKQLEVLRRGDRDN